MAFLAEIWKNAEYSISGEVARKNLIDPNIFSSPTEALTFCIKSFYSALKKIYLAYLIVYHQC